METEIVLLLTAQSQCWYLHTISTFILSHTAQNGLLNLMLKDFCLHGVDFINIYNNQFEQEICKKNFKLRLLHKFQSLALSLSQLRFMGFFPFDSLEKSWPFPLSFFLPGKLSQCICVYYQF